MKIQERKIDMENGFDQIRAFINGNLDKNCKKCSSNKNTVSFEPLTGRCEEVGIIFLGLSPGKAELEAGHPFASKDDQLCREIFREHGLMECGILLFNACCCMHTPENPPVEREIYYCFDNFEKALELVPARAVIVPTGAPSLRRMGIEDSPEAAMDRMYTYNGHAVLPMVHISSVVKGEISMERFAARLVQARELYLSEKVPEVPKEYVREAAEVKAALKERI